MEEIGKIKVLIVDDHSVVREGIRMIISNDDGVEVAGEAEDVSAALQCIRSERPDVVLLDLALTHGTSLPAIPKMLELHPAVRILILTGVVDEEIHKRALLLGAHGLLLKHSAGAALLTAIKKLHAGEAWVDRQLTAKVLNAAARQDRERSATARKFDSLTRREREIVKLIANGLNNNSIADQLEMSEKTVRNHLTVIYSKLEVASRLELALLASREEPFLR